jgi:hypothetical protein
VGLSSSRKTAIFIPGSRTINNYSLSGLPAFVTGQYNDNGTRVLDVNGDGMDDILRLYQISGGTFSKELYLNKGDSTDWTANHGYVLSNLNTFVTDYVDAGTRVLDVNGDGLADLLTLHNVQGGSFTRQLLLNKGDGTGWTTNHNYDLSNLPAFASSIGCQFRSVGCGYCPNRCRSVNTQWYTGCLSTSILRPRSKINSRSSSRVRPEDPNSRARI